MHVVTILLKLNFVLYTLSKLHKKGRVLYTVAAEKHAFISIGVSKRQPTKMYPPSGDLYVYHLASSRLFCCCPVDVQELRRHALGAVHQTVKRSRSSPMEEKLIWPGFPSD